jgi:hypothetical protein
MEEVDDKVEQLVDFLGSPNEAVVSKALEGVLGYSGSPEGLAMLRPTNAAAKLLHRLGPPGTVKRPQRFPY